MIRPRPVALAVVLAVISFALDAGARAQATDRLADGVRRAWVGFRDKGLSTESARREALARVEASLPERTRVRRERRERRRTAAGRVDGRDLPVAASYVARIRDAGARIHVRSRWLNGVTVTGDGATLDRIRDLPFVAEVRAVGRGVPRPTGGDAKGRHPAADPRRFHGLATEQARQLRVDALHRMGYTGRDVLVAVLDTGFDLSRPAFRDPEHPLRVDDRWDFVDGDPDPTFEPGAPRGEYRHGTLVLGSIAAFAPGRLVGTGYGASFLLFRAEEAWIEHELEEYWFVAALELAEWRGADVITSSLGMDHGYTQEQLDGRSSPMSRGWRIAVPKRRRRVARGRQRRARRRAAHVAPAGPRGRHRCAHLRGGRRPGSHRALQLGRPHRRRPLQARAPRARGADVDRRPGEPPRLPDRERHVTRHPRAGRRRRPARALIARRRRTGSRAPRAHPPGSEPRARSNPDGRRRNFWL